MSTIQPKFTLDFISATLSPAVTFARAGNTATRINSAGFVDNVSADVARFDYNPITLACRGLLIEDQRTNFFTYSEDFANAAWTKGAVVATSNYATSPRNTTTASMVRETAVSSNFYIGESASFTSGTAYTMSVFVHKGDGATAPDIIQMTLPSGAFGAQHANFNIVSGTVLTQSGCTATISDFGNGWFRITMTATATASTSGVAGAVVFTNNNASLGRVPVYTGATTSNVFCFGAQLEAGAFATSYIPTTSTSLTRNADVATITGANFSSWWVASQGGVTANFRPSTVSGTRPIIQYDDGTANEIITLRGNTTNPELYIVDGGTPQAQIDAGTIAANTDYSLTGWWQTNDCRAKLGSGAQVIDNTATIPTVTQARIGSDGTNYLNGHIASISYYDSFTSQIYNRRKNKAIFSIM